MKETGYIYGVHAVSEVLARSPKRVRTLYVAKEREGEMKVAAKKAGLPYIPLPSHVEREVEGENHQGVVALVEVPEPVSLGEFLDSVTVSSNTALVILGGIQDPHNVGAIIRSCAGFGISGVLVPERRQAPITGTVAKVSAGTVFSVPLVSISNINQTIALLKEKGFWIYGLAGEGQNPLPQEKFDAPAVFVVGSEGDGLREKTREHCDIVLSIPMHPRCESLNASASVAVVLSHWSAQHPGALAV